LQNEQFLSKAPEEVVDKERGRLTGMEGRRDRVVETLDRLGG
jgi:valyl-tRNA synthetase